MGKLSLFYPVNPLHINQPFGINGAYYQAHKINILGHNGIDFMAFHGQPVYAAHDGTARYETDDNQGHGVVIQTDEPYAYQGGQSYFKTIYWHFVDPVKDPMYPIVVPVGGTPIKVKAGQIIGYADNTGLTNGDHLHFGLKPVAPGEVPGMWYNVAQKNGYLGAIDPTPYFNGYYATDAEKVMANLQLQLSTAQKVVDLLRQLIGLK